MLINELKFMISITLIDDPKCTLQIWNLKAMNHVLKIAVADFIGAEEEIDAILPRQSINNQHALFKKRMLTASIVKKIIV